MGQQRAREPSIALRPLRCGGWTAWGRIALEPLRLWNIGHFLRDRQISTISVDISVGNAVNQPPPRAIHGIITFFVKPAGHCYKTAISGFDGVADPRQQRQAPFKTCVKYPND